MKYILFISLWFSIYSNTNCNQFLDRINNALGKWACRIEESEPDSHEPSLILAVETTGRCYIVNAQFVLNRLSPIYQEFLFVCPPESEEEINLNKEYSKTRNALFIQKGYVSPSSNSSYNSEIQIIDHRCKNPVVPSIINIGPHKLNNPENDFYLVGYEVYLDKRKKLYSLENYEAAELKDERFAWFNLYTIVVNRKTHNVVSVFSHTLSYKINFQPPDDIIFQKTLEDYSLGNDVFPSVSSIYGEDNQKFVFNALMKKFPSSITRQHFDWEQGRNLKKVHLAPSDSFGIPLLRRAAQTYGNIAPMWSVIYKTAWSRLENRIKFLARGMNGINEITGTYGTLKLSGIKIHLGIDGNEKVPAAFWKIVSYSPKQDENYNIFISTINNPYEDIENALCKKSLCKDFGWEYVEQTYYPMGRTSCCELTEEILAELEIKKCARIDKPLNLNAVPHWKNNELTLNVKKYVENQINGIDDEKPVDDDIYKNNRDLIVADEDADMTFSEFAYILYENYFQPLVSSIRSFSVSKKDGMEVDEPNDKKGYGVADESPIGVMVSA